MPITVIPARCPDCDEPFQLGWPTFREARTSVRANVVLLGGVVATVLLLPTLLAVVSGLVSEWTAGLGLHRKERGLLFGLAYLLAVPIALLPGWAAWRWALSRPRHTATTCPKCRWSGP